MNAILSLLVSLSVLLAVASPNRVYEDHKGNERVLQGKVDSITAHTIQKYNIPGLAIGVCVEDKVFFSKGYGRASIKAGGETTDKSIFHTASISKLFTAIAVMKVIESGKLSLNTRLVAVIPELDNSSNDLGSITVESLLNHTSGLPDVKGYGWKKPQNIQGALDNYVTGQRLKPTAEPLTKFNYSNLGYDVLGVVVERVTGLPFETYVKLNVLNEYQMLNSSFDYLTIEKDLRTFPHSKHWLTGKVTQKKYYPYNREHSPSSTLNSSVQDLLNWMIQFNHKKDGVLSVSTKKAMTTPSTKLAKGIGLGFQLYTYEEDKLVGHYGGDVGYRSFLLMNLDKRIGVVLLANYDRDEDFRDEIVYPVYGLIERNAPLFE